MNLTSRNLAAVAHAHDLSGPAPRDAPDLTVSRLCVPGAPVTDELIAAVAGLEHALAQARREGEDARSRLQRDQDKDDEELAAALATCRELEREKLIAFGLDTVNDADVFGAAPASPAAVLTWAGLRAQWEARHNTEMRDLADRREAELRDLAGRHEAEARDLAARYLGELQGIAVANAEALQRQARDLQARFDEAARQQAIAREDLDRQSLARAAELGADLETLRRRTADLEAERDGARREAALAHQHVHELLSSTSWKASRPLRGVSRVLRWLRGS